MPPLLPTPLCQLAFPICPSGPGLGPGQVKRLWRPLLLTAPPIAHVRLARACVAGPGSLGAFPPSSVGRKKTRREEKKGDGRQGAGGVSKIPFSLQSRQDEGLSHASPLNTAAAYRGITSSDVPINSLRNSQRHSQVPGGPHTLAMMSVSSHNRTYPGREGSSTFAGNGKARGGSRRT